MNNSRARLKIIAIGFNTYGTGLTRVMHNIMRRLADRHEIHYLGIGYSGETIRDRGLTIYPTNPKGGDVFAASGADCAEALPAASSADTVNEYSVLGASPVIDTTVPAGEAASVPSRYTR